MYVYILRAKQYKMKNIVPYNENTFDFHKKVISKKRNPNTDPNYKTMVLSYNDAIQAAFTSYDEKFIDNQLEEIQRIGYTGVDKERLLKLYSYKAKIFQKLKVKMTTRGDNIIDNICQNCTISEVNSFDYILPKDEFCEFVVHPKNLFPSCTKCNSYKNAAWLEDGRRLFLNLYTDILPSEQYLFVEIEIEDDDLKLTYSIDNRNNITVDLFNIINTHYEKLHLCQRFKENSDVVVSELEIEINKYKLDIPINRIKEIVQDECIAQKELLGHNYWKAILKLALINNEKYMSRFN